MKKTIPGIPLRRLKKLKMVKPVKPATGLQSANITSVNDSYLMFAANQQKKPA